MTAATIDPVDGMVPLVVDLDGTLVRSDLLVEALFKRIVSSPSSIFFVFSALLRGKAHFKDVVAQSVSFDPASLPYDNAVLSHIRDAVTAGRPVYIASASNARFVSAVADHLRFFAGWFGSDGNTNLSSRKKRVFLSRRSVRAGSIISAMITPTCTCGPWPRNGWGCARHRG